MKTLLLLWLCSWGVHKAPSTLHPQATMGYGYFAGPCERCGTMWIFWD
jgi:hypothetical protein